MDVTLPNGKVIKGVPEGTSKEEVKQKAIAAGLASKDDFPSATGQTQQPEPTQQPNQQEERGFFGAVSDLFTGAPNMTEEIESVDMIGNAPELNEFSWGAFKTSLGLLTQGDDDGAVGVIKENIPEAEFRKDEKGNVIVDLPSGSYALNKPGLSPQDVAKGAFDLALFTPAGRAAGIGGAAAGAAATEAAKQATGEQLGGSEVDLGDAAAAGALGGGFKAGEKAIDAVRTIRSADIPEEAADVIQAGEREGVRVTTSDVIEPETFVGKTARSVSEQTPFAGTGKLRQTQQQAREQAVERLTSQTTPQYDEVIQSLKRQQSKVKRAAGDRLGRIADQLGEKEIPAQKAIKSIDDEIEAITAKGRVADEQTAGKLQEYKQALEEGQTLKSLDTLRSDFREQVKGDRVQFPNRSEAALNRIYKSMSDDIDTAITENIGKDAARRWKDAKAVYANEAQKVKNTRLKGLFEKGDLTPENAKNLLLSKKPSEVKSLYSSLDNQGRQAARATLLSEALEKSLDAGGDLSVDRFATQLQRLKPQINIMFKGAERKQLQGLEKLLNATRQAQQASVATQTGQQTIPYLVGAGAATDLGATLASGATIGSIARIYESAPVRNALLKLNASKSGSDAFRQALQDFSAALSSSAQATRSQER